MPIPPRPFALPAPRDARARGRRTALLAAVALPTLAAVHPARGASPAAAPLRSTPAVPAASRPVAGGRLAAGPERAAHASDSLARQHFHVPAQPVGAALADFATQAAVRVSVDTGAVARLRAARSPGVTGVYAPHQAIRQLLAGTGLEATFTDERTVVVALEGARPTARAQALGRVVVQASVRRRDYGAARTTTATRTDTPLRDTPQAVTVVGRQLIADQAMQSMADVVRWIPGVVMGQGEGHRDAPTIRGNSTTADFYVDGVRDDVQYLRDLYNVERVEALKGSNAMIFGRGGGGGVINRVLKDAQWAPTRELAVAGASFDQRRATIDVGQGAGGVAARVNGMLERSGTFRREGRLERYGVNPTVALVAGPRTLVRLGYELFGDERTVDRGIPSFQGRPSPADARTFFGDPDASQSRARVQAGMLTVEHTAPGGLTVRNRTRYADYEKYYRNVFPNSALNAAGTQLALGAYEATLNRRNAFTQTDLILERGGGAVRHTLLGGVELGRQGTDNVRNTGYFGNTATSAPIPFAQPTVALPVTYRQSATDANNHVLADVAAVYAQDQLALGERWQAVVGVRAERFALRLRNYRNGQTLRRTDQLLAPRAGLVFKPREVVSLYGSYALSYLPSAGDQFAALTPTTQTLRPERFDNRELGLKWELRPTLALTAAAYQLDRLNTAAPDPADPTRTVQTGSQRTRGWELGLTGDLLPGWQLAAGLADQTATITSTTAAARAGQTVPLVPRRTASLWNRYQLLPALGLGAGVVHQTRMYAAIDNAVTLPAFTRWDAAAFVRLPARLRAQVNVENLLDVRYFPTSHGNNNILPGAGRTVRVTLATGL